MKMINITRLAAITALAASAFASNAATLNIGDPAPKLEVSKWVQGDAVTEFKPGTVYIVEFWATWCGPCRASIPHLNQVYLKFKDKGLVVIGQDVWEKDTTKVEPFLKQMGTNMTYRVALDSVAEGQEPGTGKMAENWMTAADANGIPTAFLVDKTGKIAWIGHPMNLEEKTIEEVQAGTFDVKKAVADREKEQAEQKELSKNQGELMKQSKALGDGLKNKDWDKAGAAADAIEKLLPEAQKSALLPVRLKILLGKGDGEGASKVAAKSLEGNTNAMLLNALAWELAVNDGVKKPDLDLAAKIAEKANELTKGENGQIIDTLARITFQKGDKAKAIELQTKAISLVEADDKEALQKTLDSYKEGKLPKVTE